MSLKSEGIIAIAFYLIDRIKTLFSPYLDGGHQRPFAGVVKADWSWTSWSSMLRYPPTAKNKIKIGLVFSKYCSKSSTES